MLEERLDAMVDTAPRRTTAFAVETNVNDGLITSSPGFKFERIAAISSADASATRYLRLPAVLLQPVLTSPPKRAIVGEFRRVTKCNQSPDQQLAEY